MDLSDRSSGLWTYEAVNFWVIYEGESNENLKFVIKNRNFAPLSCELVSVLQTACRMACRWQHTADARTRHSISIKMAAPLETCTREEQRSVIRFLRSKGVKPIEIHRRMKVQYGDACLSQQQVYE